MSPDDPNKTIDPPENTGGGNVTASGSDATTAEAAAAPIDPPENTGGGN